MKAKNILITLIVSVITAFFSVILYHNYMIKDFLKVRQIQTQIPNYSRSISNFSGSRAMLDFTEAADTSSYTSVVHIQQQVYCLQGTVQILPMSIEIFSIPGSNLSLQLRP